MKATAEKYDRTARVLHWVSAVVILWASISGFVITTQNVEPGVRNQIASFNVSITTLFIPFFFFRIWHRLQRGTPARPASLSNREALLAGAMHLFFYAVIAAVLISGVLMMPHDIRLFEVVQLPQLVTDASALHLFRNSHTVATATLGACIALHLAALAKHELSGKRILSRMI
ncbi:cytochrome b/b6 domain-containing protein [Variovorax ginsengisoli]|nr:cytochrome b/b6 domain-containing protein [Variovorax ginsengisoli]